MGKTDTPELPLTPRSRARRLSTALDDTIVDNSDQAIAAIALMSEKPHKSNPRVGKTEDKRIIVTFSFRNREKVDIVITRLRTVCLSSSS